MATHEVTFPITDPAEIEQLRAGDEVLPEKALARRGLAGDR